MRIDQRPARPVPDRVHLVGIGGAGMSGVARLLLGRGHRVTGSDLHETRVVSELRVLGADIEVGHREDAVAGTDLVVVSTAVPEDNPEVVGARARGIPVDLRARVLADLLAPDTNVLVAGTHGKTTTTSMAVVGLHACGVDPSFVVGGQLNEVGANAHAGSDPLAVAEADESDRSFLAYEPDVAVVTNVELDHPDEFEDLADVTRSFRSFLARRRGERVVLLGVDDPGAAALSDVDGRVVTYGERSDADVRLVVSGPGRGRVELGGDAVDLALAVPGRHNLRNATAALATVWLLGHDPAAAAARIATFTGAQRRFQRLGSARGVAVVDDYAHHPTELATTIEAARAEGPGRVVVVVQPHRYSRTRVLGAALGVAAAAADVVVVTEVYAGPETPEPGVSGRLVADAAREAGGEVVFEPHLADVPAVLAGLVREGDLVLVTGAGDVTRVGPELLDRLRTRRG